MSFTVPSDRRNASRIWTRRRPRAGRKSEDGFTIAALLVILTILAVVLAFTVPRMWSDAMKRERDIHTAWVVKQYARAIADFQKKRGGPPASLEQLKEQNNPRIMRQLYPNPLSGKLDWVLLPPGTQSVSTVQLGGTPQGNPNQQPPQGTGINQPPASGLSGEYKGPFIGVRPPNTGKAYVMLNGSDEYENWVYTTQDLEREINERMAGGQPNVGVGGVPRPGATPAPKP